MTVAADINRLMSDTRIKLAGAIDNVIQQELFNAADEFLKGSNLWQENIPVPVVGDGVTTSYGLVTATDGVINRFMWAVTSKGFPVRASMSTPGTLDLVFAPTSSDTYTVTVALTVTDPADSTYNFPKMPDWALTKYRTNILDGILGKMMSHTARPYSNPTLAVYHLKRFNNAIALARIEAAHGNVYRGQSWKYPSQAFASGRQRGSAGFGDSGVGQ